MIVLGLYQIFNTCLHKNQLTNEEKEVLTTLKQVICKILDAKTLNDAKKLCDKLIDKKISTEQLHRKNSMEIHHSLL